jgi:hypothetical protein
VTEAAVQAVKNLISEEHLTLREQASTPTAPVQDEDANIYVKGGNLVVQYDDGGTVRYKYLTLTDTSVEWKYDTTPP